MALDSVKSGQILAGPGSTVKQSTSGEKFVAENAKNLVALNAPLSFAPPKAKDDPTMQRLEAAINGPIPDASNSEIIRTNNVRAEGREQSLKSQSAQYNNTNPLVQGLLLTKSASQNTQVFTSTGGLKFKTSKEELNELKDEYASPWSGDSDGTTGSHLKTFS